ncbi:hypothetical protein [Haloarcula halophila]|uniref:hypothetical protein n=1 Tax=Haloarcula TaxID=2237 RepID=UPI0023E43F6F|nr:hypothetical protein [Halomicroarcula sp. DFY41]
MPKALSIGHDLEFADRNCNWSANPNIKDYKYVFMDISTLDAAFRVSEADLLTEHDYIKEVNFPEKSQVRKAIETGTNFIATLPRHIKRPYDTNPYGRTLSKNYFAWLPSGLDITVEYGKSINPDSIDSDWDWYFNGNEFEWFLHFASQERLSLGSTNLRASSIVENEFERSVAVKICPSIANPGKIYLIPHLSNWEYRDLIQNILTHIFEEGSTSEVENSPDWTSKYELPDESTTKSEIESIKQEIAELESSLKQANERLEDLKEYKLLLYGGDKELEDLVPKVFREFGFDVEGEQPHGRDGLVELDSQNIVLETTGTTGGAKKEKARQLDDWVEELVYDDPERDYTGLLVINPFRREDPEDRDEFLHNHVEQYMDQRGYKVLATETLFRILVDYRKNEVGQEDIRSLLLSDEVRIEYTS